jgi:hypothetical protein
LVPMLSTSYFNCGQCAEMRKREHGALLLP